MNKSKIPEYQAWKEMRRRCLSKKNHAYDRYGGRGIKICEQWSNFEAFLKDMGPRPSKAYSLDRYPDNNGNYEPGNCRWANAQQQAQNTRRNYPVTFLGRRMVAKDFALMLGIDPSVLTRRMRQQGEFAQLAAAKILGYLPQDYES